MRFTTVTVTLLGAVASAAASTLSRRQSAIPDCAMPCLANAVIPSECQPTDNACLCRNEAFIAGTTTCVRGACSGQELQAALFASQELCRRVGVTLTEGPTDAISEAIPSSTDAPPTPSSSGAASGTSRSSTGNATSTSGTSGSSTGNATSTSGTAGPSQTSPKSSAMTTSINAFTVVAVLALAAFSM